MARAYKVHTVNSDASAVDGQADRLIEYQVIDPQSGKPFKDENGKPSVIVTIRPVSNQKYRQIVQDNTTRVVNKYTRAMEAETDWDAVQDDLITFAVDGWTGIIGADDKPLQCVVDAKLALPGELKNDIIRRACQGEGVDLPASFR